MKPVIVVGSGRSGTSFCTMLLHTRLGINMGDSQFIGNSWRPDKWRTTKGNWERGSTRLVLHACMKQKELAPFLIVEVVREIGHLHERLGERWGFKHPNFTYYLPMLLEYFPDAYYIHCWRKAKQAAKSMKVIYHRSPTTEDEYFRRVLERQKICRDHLSRANNYLELSIEDYKKYGEDGVMSILSDFTGSEVLPEPIPVPEPYHMHGPCGGLIEKHSKNSTATADTAYGFVKKKKEAA